MKTVLYVSVALKDLRHSTGAAVTTGGSGAGTFLSAETARRLACDGGIIPTVLGTAGELLDLGRMARLFSPAQLRALWLRDKRCTFPGCAAPAQWSDAHHLHHWVDGGTTALANAALLCARHHTIVHRDRLHGVLTPTGVRWDRVRGSYDRWLTRWRCANAPPDAKTG